MYVRACVRACACVCVCVCVFSLVLTSLLLFLIIFTAVYGCIKELAHIITTRVIQEVMRTHPLFLQHLIFIEMVYMYIMIYYRFFEI